MAAGAELAAVFSQYFVPLQLSQAWFGIAMWVGRRPLRFALLGTALGTHRETSDYKGFWGLNIFVPFVFFVVEIQGILPRRTRRARRTTALRKIGAPKSVIIRKHYFPARQPERTPRAANRSMPPSARKKASGNSRVRYKNRLNVVRLYQIGHAGFSGQRESNPQELNVPWQTRSATMECEVVWKP